MPNNGNAVDVEYGVTVTSFAFTIICDRNFNPIREPTDSYIVSVHRVFFYCDNPKRTEKITISCKPMCPRDTFDVPKSQIQMVNGGAHTIDRRRRAVFLPRETKRTCSRGIGWRNVRTGPNGVRQRRTPRNVMVAAAASNGIISTGDARSLIIFAARPFANK